MGLQLTNNYIISKETEFALMTTKGISSIGEAIKARGQKVIKDHPNPVKDYIIKLAKEDGYTIPRDDISNVKFDKMKGEEKDWGLSFKGFKVLEDSKNQKVLLVYSEDEINDKSTEDASHFGYQKKITDSTTWTITAGFTVKGGVAIFSGWEIRFDVQYQTIHEESQQWTWEKDITIPPHSLTEINACLKQQLKDINVKATWRATKGKALCSCDIQKCGNHHRSAEIPIDHILVNEDLQTFDAYGVINDTLGLKAIVATHSEPYP